MEIKHREENGKGEFYIEDNNGVIAEMTYLLSGENTMIASHTGVSPVLRGQGIAMKLVEAGVAYAREKELKISPMCSYVRWAFEQREDLRDVMK